MEPLSAMVMRQGFSRLSSRNLARMSMLPGRSFSSLYTGITTSTVGLGILDPTARFAQNDNG